LATGEFWWKVPTNQRIQASKYTHQLPAAIFGQVFFYEKKETKCGKDKI
jgi:hypothetical protein